ncbi:metal-dependent hydrolase [Halovenus halobia]|uniref:metal-dependent hydrolase n=1 Tax=Halovenus halobia TaxID=3396622 RepID=UPI003F5440C4
MWPIGHASAAYLLYALSTRSRQDESPGHAATVVVGFAALVPDLIDKPLAWYLGVLPGGRTLAHSLFFLVPLSALVYLVARRNGVEEYGVAFSIGVISHTLLDALPILWDPETPWEGLVWPLLSPGGVSGEGAPTVLGLLRDSLGEPYFLTEFVLLAVALAVWRADGYPGLAPLLRRVNPA